MIKRAIDAALLRREPYLVMVVRPDGVADGAMVVAIVHALLMIPLVIDGIGVLTAAQVILYGLVNWIVLSGLVYLIGKYFLEGDGSFPGTMAATSIGYPVLLAAIVLAPFLRPLQAQLIVSIWLVATVWMAARAALDLPKARAAVAAVGGWAAFVVVSLLFRF
ncbi:MAG: YIP1 family protein [Acidimicrobiia bacterium]|nr:YIP1 family protein [Acidimicrobiia bacterium]